MAYGLEFRNKFGDRVLNNSGLLIVKSEGTLVNGPPTGMINSLVMGTYYPPNSPGPWLQHQRSIRDDNPYQMQNLETGETWNYSNSPFNKEWGANVATGENSYRYPAIAQVQAGSGVYNTIAYFYSSLKLPLKKAVPSTRGTSKENFQLAFFELPTAGLHFINVKHNNFTKLNAYDCSGLHFIVTPHSDHKQLIKYKIVTSGTQTIPSGKYGIRNVDADGKVIYDSRGTTSGVRIKDFVYITKAQMYNVIFNGASYDFPLRQTLNNPYVCADDFRSYRDQNIYRYGHRTDMPTMKIVNGNTLRVYRTSYRYWGVDNYNATRVNAGTIRDCNLMIAEF